MGSIKIRPGNSTEKMWSWMWALKLIWIINFRSESEWLNSRKNEFTFTHFFFFFISPTREIERKKGRNREKRKWKRKYGEKEREEGRKKTVSFYLIEWPGRRKKRIGNKIWKLHSFYFIFSLFLFLLLSFCLSFSPYIFYSLSLHPLFFLLLQWHEKRGRRSCLCQMKTVFNWLLFPVYLSSFFFLLSLSFPLYFFLSIFHPNHFYYSLFLSITFFFLSSVYHPCHLSLSLSFFLFPLWLYQRNVLFLIDYKPDVCLPEKEEDEEVRRIEKIFLELLMSQMDKKKRIKKWERWKNEERKKEEFEREKEKEEFERERKWEWNKGMKDEKGSKIALGWVKVKFLFSHPFFFLFPILLLSFGG